MAAMKGTNDRIPDGLYPMRAVTRFTGLTADVVRVWERRYGAVSPARTAGHARRYTAQDVRRLLLMHEAVRRGHSIGDVARLEDDALRALLEESSVLRRGGVPDWGPGQRGPGDRRDDGPSSDGTGVVAEYLGAVTRFEMHRALDVLGAAAAMMSPERFVTGVVLPILDEVGERWSRADLSVAQEHVVSAQVKGFLLTMLRMAPAPGPGAGRVLVGTPSGHLHEIGALTAAWLAAARGWDTIYVGPDIPLPELELAARMADADLVLLSLVREVLPRERPGLCDAIDRLAATVPVWVGAPEGHAFQGMKTRARRFTRLDDLGPALDGLAVSLRR
jgi:methanogenic corrinoid protein MtbC1